MLFLLESYFFFMLDKEKFNKLYRYKVVRMKVVVFYSLNIGICGY